MDEVSEALAPAGVEPVVRVPQAGAHILSKGSKGANEARGKGGSVPSRARRELTSGLAGPAGASRTDPLAALGKRTGCRNTGPSRD